MKRNSFKRIAALLMAIMVIQCFAVVGNLGSLEGNKAYADIYSKVVYTAAEKTISSTSTLSGNVSENSDLSDGVTRVWPFVLSSDNKISIKFSNDTYGDLSYAIFDSEGEKVWGTGHDFEFDAKSYTIELPKGHYEFKVYSSDSSLDEFYFTIGLYKMKAPTLSLKVTAVDKIKLSWKKVTGASGYYIYRYDSTKGKYVKIKTISNPDTLSWTNEGLTKGKKYTYKISAFVKNGTKTTEGNLSEKKYATPRENAKYWHPEETYPDSGYGEVNLYDKSVSYSNGKLVYKALACNNRIFHADYFDWIRITVTDGNGNIIAKQTFKNKTIGLNEYRAKTMTFTFNEGTRKVINLRYADLDIEYEYVYTYTY